MALLVFQKPDKLVFTESTPTHGRADFKPLEPGYGLTIGNALRRILLSSPVGFAINSIKISGVAHEFATVPGVVEDVTNIILNLKKVRFKQIIQGEDDEQYYDEPGPLAHCGSNSSGLRSDRPKA